MPAKKRTSKKRKPSSKKGGQISLKVLEKRAQRLVSIVKKRGGKVPK